ncbi:MAG: indolepyruvate ferredoxin oxidoreductase subunit alpha [Chloroflexota bacterium]
MKKLLSGNEAIALGAYHAGVAVATAYPGTPSTEIMESLAPQEGLYTEWSTNEKVALEVGMGAAYGGVRTMVVMKHVGLNVAADPFFAVATTGISGGLVIVSCDDPGLHSSQGEQDNRNFARFARVPLFEPTDSEDAYLLMAQAFQVSEEFDSPVMLRSTTRISHCKGVVNVVGERKPDTNVPAFKHNPTKYVMIPAYARLRRQIMEERLKKLAAYVEDFPLNRVFPGSRKLGVIASGVAYQYAREVFRGASFLKLVTTYPMPANLVRRFAAGVEKLVVIEELDPFLEEQIRLLGIEVSGKSFVPVCGELTPDIVAEGAAKAGLIPAVTLAKPVTSSPLPPRPPLLCAGCPHRATEYLLKRMGFSRPGEKDAPGQKDGGGIVVTSDIGCYTLGVMAPLFALDTCACMGASIGQALGLEKAGIAEKVVAVIGDSTFMHSGITGLVDVVYNQGKITVIILDNGTTAMTGHQGNPATGVSARREEVGRVDLETLVRGIGIKKVDVVSAFDLNSLKTTIKNAVEAGEPSVVIVRGNCPLNVRLAGKPLVVDREKCNNCHLCLSVGCPAISLVNGETVINELCQGASCAVCAQVCPREAISEGAA